MQIPTCSLMGICDCTKEEQLGGSGTVRNTVVSPRCQSFCATLGKSLRYNYFKVLRSTETFTLRLTNAL